MRRRSTTSQVLLERFGFLSILPVCLLSSNRVLCATHKCWHLNAPRIASREPSEAATLTDYVSNIAQVIPAKWRRLDYRNRFRNSCRHRCSGGLLSCSQKLRRPRDMCADVLNRGLSGNTVWQKKQTAYSSSGPCGFWSWSVSIMAPPLKQGSYGYRYKQERRKPNRVRLKHVGS
jgi:hypothetical protein